MLRIPGIETRAKVINISNVECVRNFRPEVTTLDLIVLNLPYLNNGEINMLINSSIMGVWNILKEMGKELF